LDEIQYAPQLLPAIKRRVDLSGQKGLYYLSGSQNLSILRSVSESMAGRIGIVQLANMSLLELSDMGDSDENWLQKWLSDPQKFDSKITLINNFDQPLAKFLWRGTFPALLDAPDSIIPEYFNSYTQTYVERDIRIIENIRDLSQFGRFIRITAALTAQEINPTHIGREIGVNPDTAKRWLNMLNYGYQWIELPPYSGNAIKRISKKRKGYYTDTGFVCYLQNILSPEALLANPLWGSIFKTFAINQISKQLSRFTTSSQLYHWRTNGGAEVDIVIEINGKLFPIEIKAKTNLSGHDVKGLRAFLNTYKDKSAPGLIYYAGKECYKVTNDVWAIPWLAE
jgi:predicted AAA+ superfamily ATPase